MALYEQWQQMAELQQTPEMQHAYWSEYFEAEAANYKKKFWQTARRSIPASSLSWQRPSA